LIFLLSVANGANATRQKIERGKLMKRVKLETYLCCATLLLALTLTAPPVPRNVQVLDLQALACRTPLAKGPRS
jgi:hypothetical protein